MGYFSPAELQIIRQDLNMEQLDTLGVLMKQQIQVSHFAVKSAS